MCTKSIWKQVKILVSDSDTYYTLKMMCCLFVYGEISYGPVEPS